MSREVTRSDVNERDGGLIVADKGNNKASSLLDEEEMMYSYNPSGRCPKCGGDAVETVHHKSLSLEGFCRLTVLEHLHRSCDRCGYEWAEMPLDNGETKGVPYRGDTSGMTSTVVADGRDIGRRIG